MPCRHISSCIIALSPWMHASFFVHACICGVHACICPAGSGADRWTATSRSDEDVGVAVFAKVEEGDVRMQLCCCRVGTPAAPVETAAAGLSWCCVGDSCSCITGSSEYIVAVVGVPLDVRFTNRRMKANRDNTARVASRSAGLSTTSNYPNPQKSMLQVSNHVSHYY